MTTFFDARFIRFGAHDGISRFAANLFSELAKLRPITAIINDERQLKHLPEGTKYVLECAPTSPRELGLAHRLNALGATLVYSPMQTTGANGKKFKLVLTLHDMIYYRHRRPPREFSLLVRALWRLYHWSYLPARLLLNKADALVTISETSRQLIQNAKLYRGQIEVVFNASEMVSARGARDKPGGNKLVYMGSFMEYKNVETLIRGMVWLPNFELHLLSAVSDQTKARLVALAGDSSFRVVFHNGVSDVDYRQLLSEAFALVSASKDEGFGIPLIEAMSLGTPVVCSDIPIFREVADGAALYFYADDAGQFANQVLTLGNDWRQASQKALENAERFSWADSARKLDGLFAELQA
jgi:glycosyltransferase involved in cell wall biosynthesis